MSSVARAEFSQVSPRAFSRVLFVACPTGAYCREDRCQSYFDPRLIPTMRPPLEECEAAGAVKCAGGVSKVLDCPALGIEGDAVLAEIRKFEPDLLVLSVTFGSLDEDLRWAARLKESFQNIPIGLRGAPCYVWDTKLIDQNSCIDFTIRGDYEAVFAELVTRGIAQAAGITYRDSTGLVHQARAPYVENLDTLPLPDRSGIDEHLYRVRTLGATQATVRVQRGCPFLCTYCLVHTVSGNKARHRSPAHIVDEIKSLQRRGISFLYFRAETFSLNKAWTLELCRALAKDCPGIYWVTTTRVECVDDEIIAAMRKAGCYGISFGVDVASAEIGRRVRKAPRLDLAKEAMRLCDRHGIISLAYIMIGFIWDTPATLREASDFIHAIRPDLVTVHFAFPYPGTAYYQAVQEAGASAQSTHAQAAPAFELERVSSAELERFARGMLRRHYWRPRVLFSLATKLLGQCIHYLHSSVFC